MDNLGTVIVCALIAFAAGAVLEATGFFSWLGKFFPWTRPGK